jgi:hypothetical protein
LILRVPRMLVAEEQARASTLEGSTVLEAQMNKLAASAAVVALLVSALRHHLDMAKVMDKNRD